MKSNQMHLILFYLLQNNLSEFTTRMHKFKSLFCTEKLFFNSVSEILLQIPLRFGIAIYMNSTSTTQIFNLKLVLIVSRNSLLLNCSFNDIIENNKKVLLDYDIVLANFVKQ